jgi:hypothetical protein
MINLRYVVTGTGRSGTVYLANLLTKCGVPCGHESIFTPWGLEEARARLEGRTEAHVSAISRESCGDWAPNPRELVADSSYMAAPFLDQPILQEATILHIVRHPLDVINSFVVGLGYFQQWIPPDPWHHFIYTHVPELRLEYHPLERAALYYLRWNQMIEKRSRGKAYFFCPVERVTERLFPYLGKPCPDASLLTDRKVNTRMTGKPEYTIHDIPAGSIRNQVCDMGERYGYPLPAVTGRRHPMLRRVWKALNYRV